MNDVDTHGWNKIYRDLEKTIGLEATLNLYQEYRGMQLNLPIRLISRSYMLDVLRTEYNGYNKQELARRFGYSQRSIERMLREIKDTPADEVKEEAYPPYLIDLQRLKNDEKGNENEK